MRLHSGSSPTPSPSLVKPPPSHSLPTFSGKVQLVARVGLCRNVSGNIETEERIRAVPSSSPLQSCLNIHAFLSFFCHVRPRLLDFHPLRRIFTSVMSDLMVIGSSHTSSHARRGRKRGNNEAGSGEICNFPPHVCRWNNGRTIYGYSHRKPFRD